MSYNPSMQAVADWMARMTRTPACSPLILDVRSESGMWLASIRDQAGARIIAEQNGVTADSALRKLAARLPA